MKDRVLKVVWVDKRGRMWSAMKGVKRFFSKAKKYAKTGLRYREGKETTPRADDKQYLFAFASIDSAVAWVKAEFDVDYSRLLDMRSGKIQMATDRGHLEIWVAEGEVIELPDPTRLLGKAIGPDFYDAYVRQGAPVNTLFCRSLRLVERVTNLL